MTTEAINLIDEAYSKAVDHSIQVVKLWITNPEQDWNDLIKKLEALKKIS